MTSLGHDLVTFYTNDTKKWSDWTDGEQTSVEKYDFSFLKMAVKNELTHE